MQYVRHWTLVEGEGKPPEALTIHNLLTNIDLAPKRSPVALPYPNPNSFRQNVLIFYN